MQYMFSRSIVDPQGRLQAVAPPVFNSDEKNREAAIEAYMLDHAKLYRSTSVTGSIIPSIQQIILEHRASVQDFYELVENNPFVPSGREMIYAQGLHAGIHSDFLKSTHLLVPQIENSLRYVLEQCGVATSSPDQFGVQHLVDLNKMLNEMQNDLAKVFTRNMIFDLRGLLTSSFGDNLRNEVAHGKLSAMEFNSTGSIYLWWLALRLCCEPVFADRVSTDADEAGAGPSGEAGGAAALGN